MTSRKHCDVLLVEDCVADACLIGEMLGRSVSGTYSVRSVKSIVKATEALDEATFDVILLDLALPDSVGVPTVSRIHELAPDTPIIVLTGLDDEALAVRAIEAGAQDYLVKTQLPIGMLTRTIHNAIERQRTLIELRAAREREQLLASHDSLTGLPNRRLFFDRLQQATAYAERHDQVLAVLYIDLDRFKPINDSYGHAAGDSVLKRVSDRISKRLRGSDTVARIGGDEFAVIATNLKNPVNASKVAQDLIAEISRPYEFDDYSLTISASIGIAVYPRDANDSDEILKRADSAMYRVKNIGAGCFCYFAQPLEGIEIEEALTSALENEELALHYQPIVDLRSGRAVASEALLRWHVDGQEAPIRPSRFLRTAEESGLIVPIGEWVIRSACGQLRSWRDKGFDKLRMAINVSPRQLQAERFPSTIAEICREADVPTDMIELELTESTILEALHSRAIEELKSLGFRIALDDFGTGFSSLELLRRLDVDVLKIDASFVRDLGRDGDDGSVAKGIIAMARSMNLETVAEGIETKSQAEQLVFIGCDYAQGYYFCRPRSAESVESELCQRWTVGEAVEEPRVTTFVAS